MADEEKTQVSAKVQKIVDAVKELSLMEVSELVKALEEEFGVTAAAPMMAAPAAVPPQATQLLLRKKTSSTSSSRMPAATKLPPLRLSASSSLSSASVKPKPL